MHISLSTGEIRVGVKGQGWRECGAERINIHPLLLHECHLRQSKIKEYYFLLYRITAMIPSTVHAPSVLNTSVDYYVSLLKLMTCAFQILELWGYLLTCIDFKKSRRVKCYSCCFTKIWWLRIRKYVLFSTETLLLELKGNTGKSVNSVNCFG